MQSLPTYSLLLVAPAVVKPTIIGSSTPWPVASAFFQAADQRLVLELRTEKPAQCVWLLNLGASAVVAQALTKGAILPVAGSFAFETGDSGLITLELQSAGTEVALFLAQLPLASGRTTALWQRILCRQRLPAAWLELLKTEMRLLLQPQTPSDTRLLQAVQLLEAANGPALSIEQLSKAVGMNVTSLKKAFKAHTGRSIFKYQQLKRLQAAAQALLHSELSISTISEQAGYLNQRHFATAFKKAFGATPAAYRTRVV